MRSTTIILVRHGHVEGIDQPRFRGRMHLQLTAAGLNQAEQTSQYVARICPHPHRIYSSPMTRCITTASIIGRAAGLAPIPEEGFTDLDYGSWQGRLVAEVERESPVEVTMWFKSPQNATIPGGERLQAMSDRVLETLDNVLRTCAGQAAVIVGHDSVNRIVLMHALGVSLERYWHLSQAPGAVNKLLHEGGDWKVESLNETAHLIPTMSHSG